MSMYHQIFVRPGEPRARLLADLAAFAGRELEPIEEGPVDYAVRVERGVVELESQHDYEEDFGMPFEQYDLLLTVRDYDRDLERQEQMARRVFDHLAATGRYNLLLVFDLQKLLDAAPPMH
ncbi:hypothetical protein ABZ845_12400 [Streptomyces sp. NPDC047022]|uniref:hypothetical protein n=1 Tax=Streptomyces sp. NPDC047022 TaxID=3155737 RepID=UPI00340744A3